ncbi:hypothetical protein [Bradyrhizobium sp. CCBAU 45384]|uniref:hypothetical protein n=1 Tax=Bradyrhizobium sp. CCBAU 45384 TaxID=858428 RepID=UPI0023062A29|nr:hypothetical protein [Bradyrhizobium sp. CCBAU 45384]MDA9406902.1 hypothetical protein [Bradyrhizobium sp. CCBAU 45384]
MAITFVRLQEYLDKIAAKGNLDPADSGHGVFWEGTYQAFLSGVVPNKHCGGHAVPIVDPNNKVNSAFYQILKAGWCTSPAMPQMPRTGPFVTDAGYSITLSDNTVVTGAQILQDIEDWLKAGAPEHG